MLSTSMKRDVLFFPSELERPRKRLYARQERMQAESGVLSKV
jgi:hypothetical protein